MSGAVHLGGVEFGDDDFLFSPHASGLEPRHPRFRVNVEVRGRTVAGYCPCE